MRPYLAILIDSFHAAFASRVLWCALIAIWIVLAAIAPVGYREDLTTTFRWRDFDNGTKVKAMLATALLQPDQSTPAVVAIAGRLPADLQNQLRAAKDSEVRIDLRMFADAFNQLLDDESWYTPAAFARMTPMRELRQLEQADEAELTTTQRQRRARLRLENAFPGVFQGRAAKSTLLTYAGYDFPAALAIDKSQFVLLVNQLILPQLINWLLGFAVVFLGILVTSSLIPDLLQPGSLHLLLSKPVSRPLLLLTKFAGGCVFVLLCVVQLVVGLFLIAGLRLDIWNVRLLWCIPVCVFLFAVYQSVSVLAGLKWRSPILSIGVTVMFGAMVLVIGFIGGLFDALVRRPDKIAAMAIVDDVPVVRTRGDGLLRWDRPSGVWKPLIESSPLGRDRVLRPVELAGNRIATAEVLGGRFNAYGSGSTDVQVLSAANDWQPQPGVRLPSSTVQLYSTRSGELVARTSGDLLIATTDVAQPADPTQSSSAAADWLSKLMNMQGSQNDAFASILPRGTSLSHPASVVLGGPAVTDQAWVLSYATLSHLRRATRRDVPDAPTTVAGNATDAGDADPSPADRTRWVQVAEVTVGGESSRQGGVAVSGDVVVVQRSNEPLAWFDAETLAPLTDPQAPALPPTVASDAQPNRDAPEGSGWASLTGLPPVDGRHAAFAAIATDGSAAVLNVRRSGSQVAVSRRSLPLSQVESIHWDDAGKRLWVAHHVDRVDALDWPQLTTRQRFHPRLWGWRLVDRYVVTPLRTVMPQTGELGGTVAAIIGGTTTLQLDTGGDAEEGEVMQLPILRPVLSCAGFIFAMLLIGCVYFTRSDF